MKRVTVQSEIEKIIKNYKNGHLITPQDFLHLGNYEAVKKSLSRLSQDKKILPVLRGVYRTPNYSSLLQKDVTISPKKVAEKLAKKYGWTIAPAEDTALNVLGLSTQVPSKYTYISDGPSKKYRLEDGNLITFKHRNNRELSFLNQKSATVIEAIKSLQKENINDEVRKKLLAAVEPVDIENILKDGKSIRNWIYEEVKQLKIEDQRDV